MSAAAGPVLSLSLREIKEGPEPRLVVGSQQAVTAGVLCFPKRKTMKLAPTEQDLLVESFSQTLSQVGEEVITTFVRKVCEG